MANERLIDPVNDDAVPKVDNAVSVGEDLKFQERWWKFERFVWLLFLLALIADVLGLFGEGWLAKAEAHQDGSAMDMWYERVERTSTPSILRIKFRPEAAENGAVQLFVSESVVKGLGAERVVPQPEKSVVGNGGITYTFPVTGGPMEMEIQLEPTAPGVRSFTVGVPGKQAVTERVVVMP